MKLAQWKQLQWNECTLKSSVRKDVEALPKPKRNLLLQKIANDIDWPDASLHEGLMSGFRLVGAPRASHVFKPELRPGVLKEEDFTGKAKHLKCNTWGKIAQQD